MKKTAPHAAISNATITSISPITLRANPINGTSNNDSLVGTNGVDSIYGAAGNDTLLGNAGNDTLNGGTGNDSMAGGTGNDVYSVDSTQDKVSELLNAGTDTVNSTVNYTLPSNVEKLAFYGSNASSLTGYGNELSNYLVFKSGFGSLYGFAGNDTLEASSSGSLLAGGAGNDTYVLLNTPANVAEPLASEGTDTVVIDKITAYALKTNFENLTCADTSDHVAIGNTVNNVLTGNTGNDNLRGMEGNDTIIGGVGIDTLDGGAGIDSLTGGLGTDTFRFGDALGSSNIETITDFTSGQDALWLVGGVFTAIGGFPGTLFAAADDRFYAAAGAVSGHDTTDRIIYDTSTGVLYYDADGSAAASPAVQFATLVGHPALAATDILTL
ncbi:MAG: calcium-binding protein [Methylococcaceae bacterium]|nr:MAG: calcium-binding protein [Methylococcaceae bacterium]